MKISNVRYECINKKFTAILLGGALLGLSHNVGAMKFIKHEPNQEVLSKPRKVCEARSGDVCAYVMSNEPKKVIIQDSETGENKSFMAKGLVTSLILEGCQLGVNARSKDRSRLFIDGYSVETCKSLDISLETDRTEWITKRYTPVFTKKEVMEKMFKENPEFRNFVLSKAKSKGAQASSRIIAKEIIKGAVAKNTEKHKAAL